jgi:CMP-N,N'-diacetyllegionaminic acid synthase
MIDGNSVLAIIPARGGSKGIPGKNIIDFCGKPLIAWTIEAAHESLYIDRTILSTDDQSIIEVAEQFQCEVPFIRPRELAGDTSTSVDVVIHAMDLVPGYDVVVLLQPTSPLRQAQHIDQALELFIRHQAENCISVTEVTEHPLWMYSVDEAGGLHKFMTAAPGSRRQDLPRLMIPNGAVYIIRREVLKRTRALIQERPIAYEMDARSSIDIDEPLDLELARLMKRAHNSNPCNITRS